MPKPGAIPIWSTDALYPAGSEAFSGTIPRVAPVSGLQALGWSPKQRPPAQIQNWWMNLVGQWCAYVDSGNWVGPISITGNLSLTGTLTVDEELSVAQDAHFTQDVFVTGNAGVTGTLTVVTAEKHVYLRSRRIPFAQALTSPGSPGDPTIQTTLIAANADGQGADIEIDLDVGDQLKGVQLFLNKTTSGSTSVQLFRKAASLTGIAITETTTSTSTTPGFSIVNVNIVSPAALGFNDSYTLRITFAKNADTAFQAVASWDRP